MKSKLAVNLMGIHHSAAMIINISIWATTYTCTTGRNVERFFHFLGRKILHFYTADVQVQKASMTATWWLLLYVFLF